MPKSCLNVSRAMQLVQNCAWCPFKLNETVTLERCLQELALSDPRFRIILRKLAHECVFVEPDRKIKYLLRTPNEERSDIILKESTIALQAEIKQLDEEIDYYNAQLNELMDSEAITKEHKAKLERSILVTEDSCKLSYTESEFLLERVYESLVSSLELIKHRLPKFIQSLRDCQLVKQTFELGPLYQQEISILVDYYYQRFHHNQRLALQTSHMYKCRAARKLNTYIESLCNLHRDLARIIRLLSTDEIPEEIEYSKVFEAHIDFLSQPPKKEPPQRVIYNHEPFKALDTPSIEVDCSPEIDKADDCGSDEQELSKLFSLLNEKAKSLLMSAQAARTGTKKTTGVGAAAWS